MKAICVDDEPRDLEQALAACREVSLLSEVQGFTRGQDALDWLADHSVDLALLDIAMPGMDGFTLARRIRARWPDTAVVFLTAHVERAYEAFSVRPSGYLLKPAAADALRAEAEYALSVKRGGVPPRVEARTFGGFELRVNGRSVGFERARSRELLALLVDRGGMGVSRSEAFATLWGDRAYDHSMQKQLDVYIRSLRKTLRDYGIEDIFELRKGIMRIFPDKLDCDLYRFLSGDREAIDAFRGEHMPKYPWASITEGSLERKKQEI